MNLYPVCLKLENMPCCVVGGGRVALRKIESLLACGAKVSVVSPRLCKQLKNLAEKNKFEFKKARYNKIFLKEKFLVIAATDDLSVNKKIASDASRLGLLVNVVDSPAECNFYVPSILRKKGILLAISTQGEFPGLAKKIKLGCKPIFNKYAKNFESMARFRQMIKKQIKDRKIKKKALSRLMQPSTAARIQEGAIQTADDLKAWLKKL